MAFLSDGVLDHLRAVAGQDDGPEEPEADTTRGAAPLLGVIAGRYELDRVVAQGAMGTVYRGRDRTDGREVAIKFPHEGDDAVEARFIREANALAEVADPGIVRYVDHGVTSTGSPFLAMDYLQGRSLAERLADGPLSLREALDVARSLAGALASMHARGLIHRDIKPGNVILCHDGPIKLVDLGLARRAEAPPITALGMTVGTFGYMSPEQLRGELDLDARSDVYSLGCLLFACLAGKAPFPPPRPDRPLRELVGELVGELVAERPPRLPPHRSRTFTAFAELIAEMMHRERDARPQSCDEVQRRLAQLDPWSGPRGAWRGVFAGVARPLVGRARELAALGQGSGVITGRPGTGRARLAQAILARRAGPVVWVTLHAEAERGETPLSLARAILGALAGLRGGEARPIAEAQLASRARERSGLRPEQVTQALRGPMGGDGDALGAWLEAELRALGDATLVIEHLERADRDSLELLASLRPRDTSLVATARIGSSAGRALSLPEMPLAPLSRTAVAELWSELVADAAPVPVAAGAGVPLLVEELARAVLAGRPIADGASVDSLLAKRFAALDPLSRWAARIASLFGDLFWLEGVVALTGLDREAVRGALDRLAREELVLDWARAEGAPEGVFRFANAAVRLAAARLQTAAEARQGPQLRAAWLARSRLA